MELHQLFDETVEADTVGWTQLNQAIRPYNGDFPKALQPIVSGLRSGEVSQISAPYWVNQLREVKADPEVRVWLQSISQTH